MSNVVSLRTRKALPISPAYSDVFMAAWSAYPESGRLRSSRKVAWAEWLKTLAEATEEELLGAVQRYAREDKEHRKDHGAPGFDRWLKWGRWDNWVGFSNLSTARQFPNPKIRQAVILACGEPFVVSYLDQCTIDGSVLVVKTNFAVAKLKEQASVFRGLGFTGMRRSTTA